MGEGFKRYKPPAVRDVTPGDVVQPGKKNTSLPFKEWLRSNYSLHLIFFNYSLQSVFCIALRCIAQWLHNRILLFSS